MPIGSTVTALLLAPIAKFLAKNWLSDPFASVSDGLITAGINKLDEVESRRQAATALSQLSTEIVEGLVPLFESAANDEINAESVIAELAGALQEEISSEFFASHNLSVPELTVALRNSHPIDSVQFSAAETELYNRALDEAVIRLVKTANMLPDFEVSNWAASLQLLNRLATGQEDARASIARIEEGVAHTNAMLQRLLSQQIHIGASGESRLPEDIAADGQITAAEKLRQAGQLTSAMQTLQLVLDNDPQSKLSRHTRYRLAGNIGLCAHELGDNVVAIRELRKAFHLEPENPTAMVLGSLAARLSGNSKESRELAERALRQQPTSPDATSLYIQALFDESDVTGVEALVKSEPWIADDPVCCASIGEGYFIRADYGKAEEWCKRATILDPANPQWFMLLAQAILVPVQRSYHDDPPVPWRAQPERQDRLRDVLDAYGVVIDLTEQKQNRNMLALALANRAGLLAGMDRVDAANRDLDRALQEEPNNSVALLNKGLLLLDADRPNDAHELLSRAFELDRSAHIALNLAEASARMGKPVEAIAVLVQVWDANLRESRQLAVAGELLRLYREIGDQTNEQRIVATIRSNWSDSPDAMAIIAEHLAESGDKRNAVELLVAAAKQAGGNLRDRINLRLAYLYFDQGNYADAADAFGTVVDTVTPGRVRERWIYSLYKAQRYNLALQASQEVRAAEGPKPTITEIEASIHDQFGNYALAAALWTELTRVLPDKASIRLHAALSSFRAGDNDAARSMLGSIRDEEISHDAGFLMDVAQLRRDLEMPDVLRYAYRARRIGSDDPEIHARYVTTCVMLSPEQSVAGAISPPRVEPGASVTLKRGDQVTHRSILDEDPIYPTRGEMQSSDPRAQALLNKSVGDRVRLSENPLRTDDYEIVDIQTKYIRACHESIELFGADLISSEQFSVGDVTSPGFAEQLAKDLDERHKRIVAVLQQYNAGRLTVGSVADLLGRTAVETWFGLVGNPRQRFRAANGNSDETKAFAEILASSHVLVLDATALLTLSALDLDLEILRNYDKIVVPPMLESELRTFARELERRTATGTMYSDGINRYFVDVPQDAKCRPRSIMQRSIDFVESVATTHVVNPDELSNETYSEALGITSYAAALIARDLGATLVADDVALRGVAMSEWQVGGVSSLSIITDLRRRSVISEDDYYRSLLGLLELSYSFVGINVEFLNWIARRTEYQLTDEFVLAMSALRGPDCDEDPAISIGTGFLREVWMNPGATLRRASILDVMLSVLTTGRNGRVVIRKVIHALNGAFALAPTFLEESMDLIASWCAAHPGVC